MKKSIFITAIVIVSLLFSSFLDVSEEKKSLKILVFTKTEGYRHENIKTGIEVLKNVAIKQRWMMTATEDANYFNKIFLSKIDVVVFFNTTGDILNSSEEIALESYIKNGGGFLGIHAAADTEYDWLFYQELIAAHFASHPPTQKARLIVHKETNHPAIRHLGNEWLLRDEWYSFRAPLKSHATLLMEVDDSSLTGKIPLTRVHPIAWAHDKFGGRAMYTGIGHTTAQFSDPVYLEHIILSIKWAGKVL
jgi:type 1 glutamine amidotransferase